MEDPARRLARIGATGSGGESDRSHVGAVQGSAAAVSDHVSYLSGTKLYFGRLSVESIKRQGLVEVQPQPCKTFPSGPECLPPEEGRLSPPITPMEQHYVHPGEGRSLPSKDVRRDPKQGQEVPAAIDESPVSPKIALLEPASTISP